MRERRPLKLSCWRRARALHNLGYGKLVPEIHPADLAKHGHGDHLKFLRLKNRQNRLNTLVNFERALPLQTGQFSARSNSLMSPLG